MAQWIQNMGQLDRVLCRMRRNCCARLMEVGSRRYVIVSKVFSRKGGLGKRSHQNRLSQHLNALSRRSSWSTLFRVDGWC